MRTLFKLLKNIGPLTFWATFTVLFSSAIAAPIVDNKGSTPIELGPHYKVHVDNTQTLTIEDILSPTANIKFLSLIMRGHKNLIT